MSNHTNHRRQEESRTEHGPSWSYGSAALVARLRKRYRRWRRRAGRRYQKLVSRMEETMIDNTPEEGTDGTE